MANRESSPVSLGTTVYFVSPITMSASTLPYPAKTTGGMTHLDVRDLDNNRKNHETNQNPNDSCYYSPEFDRWESL
jgi:hypothetical protein